MPAHHCQRCGGALTPQGNQYVCEYCGRTYPQRTAEKNTENLRELLNELEQQTVHNLRRNLYDAVTAKYIIREDVKAACDELKKHLPDDVAANFYRTAVGQNMRQLNQAIRGIRVNEHAEDVELIITFLIKSIEPDNDYLLALNDLIERAYKKSNERLYGQYAAELATQVEKVKQGVYTTALTRDVFVAYSSKDMDRVFELVEELEAQGIRCFVAARNLKHGVWHGGDEGDDYNRALKEAMDYCRIFLFVSSLNSRDLACDALRVEMNYIRHKDIEKAPAEHTHNYAAMPHRYKMPRVEYHLEESPSWNVADESVNEFFHGYERVFTVKEAVRRVARLLMEGALAGDSGTAELGATGAGKSSAPQGSEPMKPTKEGKPKVEKTLKQPKPKVEKTPKEPKPPKPEKPPKPPLMSKKTKKRVIMASIAGILLVSTLIIYSIIPRVKFVRVGDGYTVTVTGIFDLMEYFPKGELVIPSEYKGLPITSIGYEAFFGCGSLTSITIPDGVTSIGYKAFFYCDSLTSITIPDSVTSIEEWAFSSCDSLTSITIPDSVTSIGSEAFYGCTDLIQTELGVQYVDRWVIACDTSVTSVALRADTMGIGDSAFHECDSLTSITIPDGVTSIGEWAFSFCDSLTSITIPDSVTSIGGKVFYDCDSLTTITIPDGVTSIGDSAFYSCDSLSTITFQGTKSQWNAIEKGAIWDAETPTYTIHCTDGTIQKFE